jgi:glycosyltransferase involved in cell wall biosynthesis
MDGDGDLVMTGRVVGGVDDPVLCVSALGPDTGTLLTAFGLLADDRPGLRLEILGGGPLEVAARRRAEELGIEDRVDVRQLPAAGVEAVVRRSAVLVLPAPAPVAIEGGRPLQQLLASGSDATPPTVVLGAADPPSVAPGHPPVTHVPRDDPIELARALTGLLDARPDVRPVHEELHAPGRTRGWPFRR